MTPRTDFCSRVEEHLLELIEEEIPEPDLIPTERQELLEHSSSCKQCQVALASYRKTKEMIRRLPRMAASQGFSSRLHRALDEVEGQNGSRARRRFRLSNRVLSIAALILIVIGLGVGAQIYLSRPEDGIEVFRIAKEQPSGEGQGMEKLSKADSEPLLLDRREEDSPTLEKNGRMDEELSESESVETIPRPAAPQKDRDDSIIVADVRSKIIIPAESRVQSEDQLKRQELDVIDISQLEDIEEEVNKLEMPDIEVLNEARKSNLAKNVVFITKAKIMDLLKTAQFKEATTLVLRVPANVEQRPRVDRLLAKYLPPKKEKGLEATLSSTPEPSDKALELELDRKQIEKLVLGVYELVPSLQFQNPTSTGLSRRQVPPTVAKASEKQPSQKVVVGKKTGADQGKARVREVKKESESTEVAGTSIAASSPIEEKSSKIKLRILFIPVENVIVPAGEK